MATGPKIKQVCEDVYEEVCEEVYEDTAPSPGSIFAQKYQVERVLATGSLGVVFTATNLFIDRRVTIKVLSAELSACAGATDRFLREALITGCVKHDNIVDIYDVSVYEGKVFLMMEYLQGQSLNAWIKAQPRTSAEILQTLIQAMRGIEAAHAAGVVHRDLKPDNIFVCCDDKGNRVNTKVLDFGVSKFIHPVPGIEEANITEAGLMVGTPNYMPPEQIQDSRHVDQRADIYALGIILYESLAGKTPFSSTNLGELLIEIMQEGVPSLAKDCPALPKNMIAVVDKAVARKREQRFENVEEFINELEPFVRILDNDVGHVRPLIGGKTVPEVRVSVKDDFQGLRGNVDERVASIKRRFTVRKLVIVASTAAISLVAYFGLGAKSGSGKPEVTPSAKSTAFDTAKTTPKPTGVERDSGGFQQLVVVPPSKTTLPVRSRVSRAAPTKIAVSVEALTTGSPPRKPKPRQREKGSNTDTGSSAPHVVGNWQKSPVVDFKNIVEDGELPKEKKSIRVRTDEF